MGSVEYATIIMTIATLLFAAIIPQFGYIPVSSNVPNPWNDLTSGIGASPATSGSGTVSSSNNPSNVQQNSALEGCTMGAGVGFALAGAGIALAAFTGGASLLLLLGGAIAGLGGGCAVGADIGAGSPAGVTQLWNSVVAATGPIGSFLQGIIAVEQYVYPFLKFVLDWIPYENALLYYQPEFAGIMGLFTGVSVLLWTLEGAKLFRGVGTLG